MNTAGDDPRPLVGEPLPLDLLNTRWSDDGGAYDLLDMPGGLAIWLRSAGFAEEVTDSPETLEALLSTREALAALVQPEVVANARDLLNGTLRHGHIARRLGSDGPESVIETDTPAWRASWICADAYLSLLDNPTRIRKCANPVCSLRFYDVSKSGKRRWCSMSACGNRSKVRNHYARTHIR